MTDSFAGRLADLVVRPARLMDSVGVRPTWWQPGLLIFAVSVVFLWVTLPIMKAEQNEMIQNSLLVRLLGEAAAQEQAARNLEITPVGRIVEAVSSSIVVWVSIVISGLVLGFFANMAGGQGTIRQAVAIVSWASILNSGLMTLLKLPLVLATGSLFRVHFGLAALLPDGDPGSALYQTLMFFGDFPTWWTLVLIVIGFERVFGLGRLPATLSVLLPWSLMTLAQLGLLLLTM